MKTANQLSKREQRAREAETLSTATKIITRHKLGRQKYTEKRLKWAYKVFASHGGRARVASMTKEERSELGRKAAAASAKVRQRRAVLADLAEQVGSEKLLELIEAKG